MLKFIPLLALTAAALAYRESFAGWVLMCVIGFSVYLGCKWLTWRRALERGLTPPPGRSLAYLAGWIGMDAEGFLDSRANVPKPLPAEWIAASGKTLAGGLLLWIIAPMIPTDERLIVGWTGSAGLLLLTFFGAFHLNALLWRYFGVNARHIMRSPLLARSLAEFWGERWNLAVHGLLSNFVFRPVARWFGVNPAVFASFLVSGFAHELITSIPARGGYGMPTLYFLIQFVGMFFERSEVGGRLGLGRGGARGRIYTAVFTASPVFLLFHPCFAVDVVVPLMMKIRAI
ncbi:MAG: MBOAT family protein [Deltaproteobacteria bacterium]